MSKAVAIIDNSIFKMKKLINDSSVCPDCLEEHFKKRTEDYVS